MTHLTPDDAFSASLTYDAGARVWVHGSVETIGYRSDAYARERLLPLVEAATDLGSLSPELEGLAGTWPASYYLSSRRSNLLRPFEWNRDARVLEVGAGCGSITRFLGETFASVTAVEGELHRAAIGASRTRDQDNVSVVCAPFGALAPHDPFDIVVCVGVLEYSPLFNASADPIVETLRDFRAKLAPDGTLVLAIENKLGLKYFSGAAEDHTSLPFDGVEGYVRSGGRGPRTLGKSELTAALETAGFESISFFYPFPDYKFPRAIATDDTVRRGGGEVAEFLTHTTARDYLRPASPLTFDQRAAWPGVIENGLGGDLANSFLVVASPASSQRHVTAAWDLVGYNLAPRRPEYWTENVAQGTASESGTMTRRRLLSERAPSPRVHMADSASEPWRRGRTLASAAMDAAMAQDSDHVAVASALQPWVDLLRQSSDARGMVPGQLVDTIPQNLVVAEDGLFPIDQEFAVDHDLALHVVVIRGLRTFYTKLRATTGVPRQHCRRPMFAEIARTAGRLGVDLGRPEVWDFCVFEAEFQHEVHGSAASPRRTLTSMLLPPEAAGVRTATIRSRAWAGRVRRRAARARRG